eukprot:SAG25_NODE_487_length_7465_cov_4.695900_1_plen_160_part_00
MSDRGHPPLGGMQQPGISQQAEADSLRIGHRWLTETPSLRGRCDAVAIGRVVRRAPMPSTRTRCSAWRRTRQTSRWGRAVCGAISVSGVEQKRRGISATAPVLIMSVLTLHPASPTLQRKRGWCWPGADTQQVPSLEHDSHGRDSAVTEIYLRFGEPVR